MTNHDYDVVVTPPTERIETDLASVSLSSLFLQALFEVSVEQDARRITFEVNLPEWLQAFTVLLNEGTGTRIDELLLLSGERFVAENAADEIRIAVFDLVTNQTVSLALSREHANTLHAKLVCKLQSSADRAAGRHLEISDIDQVTRYPSG